MCSFFTGYLIVCGAYSSAKYVWPLYIGDPYLEVTTNSRDGTSGCSVATSETYSTLSYSGISLSGNPQSFVELYISSANELKAFSISLTAYLLSNSGGTIFHYKFDSSIGGDPVGGDIREIVFWFNSTTIVLDFFDKNNASVLSVAEPYKVVTNSWEMFIIRYDFDKIECKIITETDKDIGKLKLSGSNLQIRLPGILRLGAPIGLLHNGLHGYLICLVVHDTTIAHGDISDTRTECKGLNLVQKTGNPL